MKFWRLGMLSSGADLKPFAIWRWQSVWLFLVPLSHVYQAGAPDASNLEALGSALFEVSQVNLVLTIVFSLGALMFYSVLYQSRLVPRWLSGVGLIVVVISWAANLLPMLGLVSPGSPILSLYGDAARSARNGSGGMADRERIQSICDAAGSAKTN